MSLARRSVASSATPSDCPRGSLRSLIKRQAGVGGEKGITMNGREAVRRTAVVAASVVSRIARPRYLICTAIAALFVVPAVAQAAIPTCPDGQECERAFREPLDGAAQRKGLVIAVHGGGWEAPIDRIADFPGDTPKEMLENVAREEWVDPVINSTNDFALRTITYSGINCAGDGDPLGGITDCNRPQNAYDSVADIKEFVRHYDDQNGNEPIVLAGASAGGQLAYSAAGQLPAGVVDGLILAGTPYDLADATSCFTGGTCNAKDYPYKVRRDVRTVATFAWNDAQAANISPVTYPQDLPMALGACTGDFLVNYQQVTRMFFTLQAAFGAEEVYPVHLPSAESDGVVFPHCPKNEMDVGGITQAGYDDYKNAVRQVLLAVR